MYENEVRVFDSGRTGSCRQQKIDMITRPLLETVNNQLGGTQP
jgi:hypothetical protein